jgi:hypothetical protein
MVQGLRADISLSGSNTTNQNIKQLFIAPRVVIPIEFDVDPARKLVPLIGFPDILTILNEHTHWHFA